MFDRTRIGGSGPALICLEGGSDETTCAAHDLDLSQRGMRFHAPWAFTPGSQLAVVLRGLDPEGRPTRVTVDGLVVACEKIPDHRFEVTLLFLDLPEHSQEAITRLSRQLHPEAL